jgi:prepilin signal peptidase PulO-like enzyme (type II secretory pathway)
MNNLLMLLIFVFGLCIGSFINALVYRLYNDLPIGKARSMCVYCKKQLKWYHNIPLISYIFLFGKCSFCKKKISWQYPLVELITGVLFILTFYHFNILENFNFIVLLFYCFIILLLIIIFLFDLKYMIIPDLISIPGIIIIFLFQIYFAINSGDFLNNILKILLAGVVCGGFFAVQYSLSKGKWVGSGDIRLGILIGFILGWPMGIVALFLSYIIGTIYAIPVLILKKKNLKSQVPMGVFIVLAIFVVMFWGEEIINIYF